MRMCPSRHLHLEAENAALRTHIDEALRLLRLAQPFARGNPAYDYIADDVDAFLSDSSDESVSIPYGEGTTANGGCEVCWEVPSRHCCLWNEQADAEPAAALIKEEPHE